MIRITTIVGARPQFVKAAAVSRAIRANARVDETLIHTGQHYDRNLSDVFFEELGLAAPRANLGVAETTHGAMTARMIEGVEACLLKQRPDAVLVYGDTNSTLAGALAAVKLAIPVIHCEAGLRSGRRTAPEELNRIMVDHVSALLLCPTELARRNLAREGIEAGVHIIGDVMFDQTLFAKRAAMARSEALRRLGLEGRSYDVLTLHRAENTDDPARLARLIDYAEAAARERALVFPMHPRTKEALRVAGRELQGVTVKEPLSYLDFHRLLAECVVVHTDSGGVQKEAYFHRKPCVTLRDETEWAETIEAGWNRLWTVPDYAAPRRDIPAFGDGRAAERAVGEIVRFLEKAR